jgi:hypothetical protein
MMPNLKPSFDGKGMVSQFYDGPPPTPGPYRGKIDKMWAAKVQSGDNEGADKIVLRITITSGKFKGASYLHNLTMVKNSAWTINQFLHALTPGGTKKQKDIMEELFWDVGMKLAPESEKLGTLEVTPVVNIGGKFKPIDKELGFIVKNDEYKGETRSIIDRFVIPMENSEPEETTTEETVEATDEDESGSSSDTLSDMDDDSTETVEESSDDGDDDDPWGND